MDTVNLTKKNFLMYTIHFYGGMNCISDKEFRKDILHVSYLRKLLSRYQAGETINVRQLINHLTLLSNVYNTYSLVKILFFKVERGLWRYLNTLLMVFNYLPPAIYCINGEPIYPDDIGHDDDLKLKILKEIRREA